MSIDNLHDDDAEFERFLAGEGDLSRQLKGLPQEEPSAELDAAVLAKISGALAAEKVQAVEAQPAANDPVGPPAVSAQRKRSLAYYWHWPVGVAAGILLTLAYRTAFEPYNPGPVAFNDKATESRLIAPTPHVTAPADVITEPGRVATAPAVIEPPDVTPQPAPPVQAAAPAPSVVAAAATKEAAAPVNVHAEVKPEQTIAVTSNRIILRHDRETASPVQVITAEDLRKSSGGNVADLLQKKEREAPSGVELAWTHDTAQDARASEFARRVERTDTLAAAAPPSASLAAPLPAPAPVLADAAPPAKPSAAYGLTDARPVAPIVVASPVERVEVTGTAARRSAQAVDEAHADPNKWLALIEQKLNDKDNDAALGEWDKFIAAYPNFPVKDDLSAKIKALRASALAKPETKPEVQAPVK